MLKVRDDQVSLGEFLNEGLKMMAMVAIFGAIFAGIGVYGCKHNSCSAPETWKPMIEYFGLSSSPGE